MTVQSTRRKILKGGMAVAGLSVFKIPEWAMPVLAQGETLVPFTDIPDNVRWEVPPDRRTLDVRTIDGVFTPASKFATTQHYGHPEIDGATFRLKISGLVEKPASISLDELKKMGGVELVAGFECSGNRAPTIGGRSSTRLRPNSDDWRQAEYAVQSDSKLGCEKSRGGRRAAGAY